MRVSVLFLSPLFVLTVGLGVARADLAPPDQCTAPGQPCQNAGSQYDQPGTCAPATCQRSVPDADGGRTSMSYACNLCEATGAGGSDGTAGANGNGGATTAATGGVAGSTPSMNSQSSGCTLAGGRADDDGPRGLAALAAIALVVTLRRRHVSP